MFSKWCFFKEEQKKLHIPLSGKNLYCYENLFSKLIELKIVKYSLKTHQNPFKFDYSFILCKNWYCKTLFNIDGI